VSAEERVARRCHGCGLPIPDDEKAVEAKTGGDGWRFVKYEDLDWWAAPGEWR
jgi:hypothetical protein